MKSTIHKKFFFIPLLFLFRNISRENSFVTKNPIFKNKNKLSEVLEKGEWIKLNESIVNYDCPIAAPFAPSGLQCCNKQIYPISYLSSSSSKKEFKAQIDQGASALMKKKILFVGDSVGHQWLNSLLLGAFRRENNLFPQNVSIWKNFLFYNNNSYIYNEEKNFCYLPTRTFNITSIWKYSPIITAFYYPNDLCPPKYKNTLYSKCCPRGIPVSTTGAISEKLEEIKPDIVITQMGVHWHSVEKYSQDTSVMISALQNYSIFNKHSLLLFLESLPQHFDTPSGDGSFTDFKLGTDRNPWKCFSQNLTNEQQSVLISKNSTSVGILNLNHIAKMKVETSPGVNWLSTNSRAFSKRDDAHKGATKCCAKHRDCTHYCYSHYLWEPAIEPFFFSLFKWTNLKLSK